MGSSLGKTIVVSGKQYKIVSEIGTGGFASVVLVKEANGQVYALKRSVTKSDDTRAQRIAHFEASLLNELNHPNIVQFISYKRRRAKDGSQIEFLLLLEYCPGGNLCQQLQHASSPWPLYEIMRCFGDIASMVLHLHSQNPVVIHRDIKLDNILIDSSGNYKVCDFGSASVGIWKCTSPADLSAMRMLIENCTTQSYRAPEMIDIERYKRIGPEVDIWGLGCILYQLLFLQSPFSDQSKIQIMQGHFAIPPQPAYPPDVIHLLKSTLARDPVARPTIGTVMSAVRAIMRELEMNSGDDSIRGGATMHAASSGFYGSFRRSKVPSLGAGLFGPILAKATSRVLSPPKAKHVRRLIICAWQQSDPERACAHLFNEICSTDAHLDSIVAYKTLQTIHKLMQQGPPEILLEVFRVRPFLQKIQKIAAENSFKSTTNTAHDRDIAALMSRYAGYLIQRANAHHDIKMMLEGNFALGLYLLEQTSADAGFAVEEWRQQCSMALSNMFTFVTEMSEIGRVAVQSVQNSSAPAPMDPADPVRIMINFRESIVIPILDDMGAIFRTATYLLGLLRLSIGKHKSQQLMSAYKRHFTAIKSFITAVQTCPIVVEMKRVPQLPANAPKFSSRTAVGESTIFPLPSNIPTLNDKNEALSRSFREVIIAQVRKERRAASGGSLKSPAASAIPRVHSETFASSADRDRYLSPRGSPERPRSANVAGAAQSNHAGSARGSDEFNDAPDEFAVFDQFFEGMEGGRGRAATVRLHSKHRRGNSESAIDSGSRDDWAHNLESKFSNVRMSETPLPSTRPANSWNPFPAAAAQPAEHKEHLKAAGGVAAVLAAGGVGAGMGGPVISGEDDELAWEDLEVGERIGIGGFAEVFRGKWLGADVAVKKLINQRQTEETLEEFRSEVDIMRRLQHPNVTMFMGACTIPPNMCLVTELLEMSLFDLLHNTSIPLSWRIKFKIAIGTAQGLDFLHLCEPPILHRDLKSANILLDRHFDPRLADFGLSREKVMTTMTAQTGTFQWMSPEVIAGKHYTEKADVFSFGIILWELCCRKIPYEGKTGFQVSLAVVQNKARPEIDRQLCPSDWSSIMQACWSEDATSRPSFDKVVKILKRMRKEYENSQ
eukprot:842968_1